MSASHLESREGMPLVKGITFKHFDKFRALRSIVYVSSCSQTFSAWVFGHRSHMGSFTVSVLRNAVASGNGCSDQIVSDSEKGFVRISFSGLIPSKPLAIHR